MSTTITDHPDLLPHSYEAEAAVLGALMMDSESLPAIRTILDRKHFYKIANGQIYSACLTAYDETGVVDLVTVLNVIETTGSLEAAGGRAYISSLFTQPSGVNAPGYARIVWAMAYRRELINFASETVRLAHSGLTNVQDIHRRVEDRFREVGVNQMAQPRTARHLASDLVDAIGQGPRPRFPTGTRLLDKMCDGAYGPGQMVIFCAYTNQGKSHLAAQLARAAADVAPTLYVSLEATPGDIRDMMFAARCGVPETAISDRRLSESQTAAIYKEVEAWENLPLEIETLERIDDIQARMSEMSARYDFRPGMLFVDDVDSLAEYARGGNGYEKLKATSVRLLTLAIQTGWGVVGLKQLLTPSPDQTRGLTNSDQYYNMLKPTLNMVEGGRSIVQKGGTVIGMLGAGWIKAKLFSGFEHRDLPEGNVMFYGLKFRKRDSSVVSEGPMRWNPAIPRLEDVIAVPHDLDAELRQPSTHAAHALGGR